MAGVAGGASAQPVSGLYLGAGVGYGYLQDESVTAPGMPLANASFGSGIATVGSVGYGLGNGLRVELEGDWRANWQTNGPSGNGRESKAGVMVNGLFDLDVGLGWLFPYLGLGGGYQWTRWSDVSLGGGGPGGDTLAADGTAGALAYQAIVGAAVPIPAVPGLSMTVEYRFMGLSGGRDYAANGPAGAITAHTSDDANHAIMLGLRYALAPPADAADIARPPLAVPTEATIPSRTYLIFFDWDSAALSARARDIIAEAVRNSVRVQHTRFEVTGHADRTGGEEYNLALSLRRARAVADEVQRWGIPERQIAVRGVGDTQPLVATAPGVREPQNRRVEIVYR